MYFVQVVEGKMTNIAMSNAAALAKSTAQGKTGILAFLEQPVYARTVVKDWLLALAVAVLTVFVLFILKRFIRARVARFAKRTKTRIDDHIAGMLDRTKSFFLLGVGIYAGSRLLPLPPGPEMVIKKALVIVFLMQTLVWVNRLITLVLAKYKERKLQEDNASAKASISAISFISKLILWVIFLMLLLDNLGFNIKTLVAGIGISGIAVALAMQNILGDIFASFLIVLDKPFVLGDFIIIDSYMGTVEYIGLKTTRIRSLSGEQLVFANSDLIKSRIKNYKRMEQRRIVFGFGVTYQTGYEQLKAIPEIVKEIIEKDPRTKFDRAHFQKYGDSSLDFEVVYYVTEPDYTVYMDIQQEINLELFRKFEELKIEFAYPTRTILMEKGGS